MKLRLPKARIAEARASVAVHAAGFSFGENQPERNPLADQRGVPSVSDWATVEVLSGPGSMISADAADLVARIADLCRNPMPDPCPGCRYADGRDLAWCGGCDMRLDYENSQP